MSQSTREPLEQVTDSRALRLPKRATDLMDDLDRLDPPAEPIGPVHESGVVGRLDGLDAHGRLLPFNRRRANEQPGVGLDAVVAGLEPRLTRGLGEHIALVMRMGREARVSADVREIEEVVLTLALNAREAMPDGGTLTIETGTAMVNPDRPLDRSECVTLTVSDTGRGMHAETLSHVLACDDIVQRSGGCVRIDNEPGQGSRVMVFLPKVTGAPVRTRTETLARTGAVARRS